jgi:putative methionine-R-sulfoxide reductase with GAF domain
MKSQNEPTQTTSQPGHLLRPSLVNYLFSPHSSITDITERRKAQLTIALAIVLTTTNTMSLFFIDRNGPITTYYLQIILTIVTFVAYLLSRRPQFILGSVILITSLSISGFANVLSGSDNPTSALYFTIPIAVVIGGALLPVWGNVVLVVGGLIGTISLPLVYPPYTWGNAASNAAFLFTIGILLIVVQVFRNSVEREHLQEVEATNRDLRELGATLEQRIADRTKDLETVAQVSTATATILETVKLLQAVVDLSKERFELYHSHIYLLDEASENLILAAGAGEPGRIMVAEKHSIPITREQSLVARAARERKGVIVNDVTQAPDFLPNPLLPDTRSELAVPMIVGGKVIGVFDIQSDQVGRFTESDIYIQTTLAAQVSTSIQNVHSFEQSKAQADLESLVNAIGQKIQRATSVDDTLQIAVREIGLALGATRVSAHIAGHQDGGNEASRN